MEQNGRPHSISALLGWPAMCGRFVSASDPEQIAAYSTPAAGHAARPQLQRRPDDGRLRHRRRPDGTRQLQVFHWGLIPVWAKDVKIGQKMINARSETIASKGAYKADFRKHRCLIPMDGFFEWQKVADRKAKQPYFIHRVDGEPSPSPVSGRCGGTRRPAWTRRGSTAAPSSPPRPTTPWPRSTTGCGHPAGVRLADVAGRRQRRHRNAAEAPRPGPERALTMHPISTDVNKVSNNGAPPHRPDRSRGGDPVRDVTP